MVLQKLPFPQPGELVICKITAIQNSYVQVILEDYKGLESEEHAQGMVHITELSNRWVKNINSIVSMGQRLVLSVLRVNEERGYLDLSLRRVNKKQRTERINEWRYENKTEANLKFFAESHNIPVKELYLNIIWPLSEKFGDLRTAFEEIKEAGIEELKKVPELNISNEFIEDLFNFIQENVTITTVELVVEYEIHAFAGNGIELIKESLFSAQKLRRSKGLEANFIYIGAPIYRCSIIAKDYPAAEKHLQKITEKIQSVMGTEGTVQLIRDNLSNLQKTPV